MPSLANSNPLADSVALAAVVTYLVSLLKPFVEDALPFARVGASLHDATLRLLNLVLNLAVVLAFAAAAGQLDWHSWFSYALVTLAQAAGAHVLYQTTTRSGGSIADSGAVSSTPLLGSIGSSEMAWGAPAQPVTASMPVASATDLSPIITAAQSAAQSALQQMPSSH